MSVFDLKKGERAKIISVAVDGSAGERLSSLGITAGREITVLAFSLFSGSLLIACGASRVAMRKSIAQRIEVEPCLN